MAIAPTKTESSNAFFLASPHFFPQPVQEVYTSASKDTLKELDPNGLTPSVPGAKLDMGKADIYRGAITYFPKALAAIAEVSEIGAKKYSWKGWMSVPDGVRRYTAALCRHLIKEDEEEYDVDTGCHHAAQIAWNAMARLELIIREKEKKSST